jgi:multiple sugar transport system ATP-binding protein
VRKPKVFLFDEPLSNLDAKLRVQMRTEIKALHQRLKTTTVYVTHDQIEAMTMADRIVVMHDGIVEQIGTPLDLYDNPANLFVAGFIGSPAMNFISGIVRRNGGGNYIETESGTNLPLPIDAAAAVDRKVVFGIRPEHLALGASNEGVAADVQVIEPTGAETQVFVEMAGTQVTAVFTDRHDFQPGDRIVLKPRPEGIHLFDADTGRHL